MLFEAAVSAAIFIITPLPIFIVRGSHPLEVVFQLEAFLLLLLQSDFQTLEFGVLLQAGGGQR